MFSMSFLLSRQLFPYYEITADPERGTPVFKHDENTSFSPEELIAQLLNKAREFAQTSTGKIYTFQPVLYIFNYEPFPLNYGFGNLSLRRGALRVQRATSNQGKMFDNYIICVTITCHYRLSK